jgi:alpha-tubulin suppressor-like RCC1 family protein
LVTIDGDLLTNATAVAAGSYHFLALLADGTVVGCGANTSGQALGDRSNRAGGHVMISGVELNHVKSISACENYSLAVMADGRVVGWGNLTVPIGLSNVVALSAGASHCLALKGDGTVVGWRAGLHPMGLGGDGLSYERKQEEFIAFSNRIVAAVGPSIASDTNYWSAITPRPPAPAFYHGLSNIVAIAAARGTEGDDLALKNDGTVVEWPFRNREDRLTIPDGLSNVVAVASGASHCLALKADGTVVAWGENDWGQITIPHGLSNVVAISADGNTSMALKKDGTIALWGMKTVGQTRIPPGLGRVKAIAAGGLYCLTIQTSDGPLTNATKNSMPDK